MYSIKGFHGALEPTSYRWFICIIKRWMHHIICCITFVDGAFWTAFLSQPGSDGTGCLYLVGCGYNAYPTGSQYAEYPQMDDKQEDRQRRKYRFIVHAEQNALTFRSERSHWWRGRRQCEKIPPQSYFYPVTDAMFCFVLGLVPSNRKSPPCYLWPNVRVTSVSLWSEEPASHTSTPPTRTGTRTRWTFPTWGSAAWRTSASS